jgi:nitrite reductase (NADH) small subunit
MDKFVKVAKVETVTDEHPLVIEHRARRISIYKEGGQFFAIEDICPHMGAFLSHGYRKEGSIVCPWHNWEFDLSTGNCTSNDSGACVQTIPVQVLEGNIMLPESLQDEDELDLDEW